MFMRPSLVLQINLKPEDYTQETVEELKRSYIYLAQSIISCSQGAQAAEGNIMRLSIRLMRPYWDAGDPKARELWDGVMPRWLDNVTRNMSTAMHNYNTVEHPAGAGDVIYDWADYEFGANALVRVKVDAENRITEEMPVICERVRELMNRGAFGSKQVALVRVPSIASYDAQLAVAVEAQKALIAQEAAEALGETPTVKAEEAIAEAVAEDAAPQSPAAIEEPPVTFDIDYTVWGIEYEDGSIEEFDSRTF